MSATNGEKKKNPLSEFFAELLRRRVLQIAGAYIAGAWLGAEIFNFLFEQFGAPAWAYRLLAVALVVGFPIALVLAWKIQISPDGTWEPDPGRGDHRTIGWAIALGVLLTAGLSWLILPRTPEAPYEPIPSSLAILPLTADFETPGLQTAMETLYQSVIEGLEQSPEITLVQLGLSEPPPDPVAFGQSLSLVGLAVGRVARQAEGDVVELEYHDVVSGQMTWSGAYAWDPTRMFETAAAMANGLREAMQLPALSPDRFAGTSDSQAYSAFMRGQNLAAAWTAESLEQAIEEFQRAIDLDGGFVQAHVGLAQAIYDRMELAPPSEAERAALQERAERAVRIAQRLDPESPDALSLLGYGQENRQMRIVAYERALELDPGHAITYFRYAVQLHSDGELEDAERLMNRAVTLQPMNPRFRFALADILEALGRHDEATREREKGSAFRS